MTTVLVIDDDAVDREHIRRLLGGRHELIEAATAQAGIAAASASPIDCVLLDYRLPDEDGVRVLDLMTGRFLPVVMLTSQGSERVAVEALKHGAVDYVRKSDLDGERLRKAIEAAIAQGRLRLALDEKQRELEAAVALLSAQRAELEEANRTLQRREAHLRFVLGELPVVHWTTDASLVLTHLGGAGLSTVGALAEHLLGRRIGGLLPGAPPIAEVVAAHQRALAGESVLRQVAFNGRTYQCNLGALRDGSGAIVGTLGLALDVSEARELEQQLRHASKMDALGRLAGGVAHDFNNLLSVILGFAGFVRDGMAPDDARRHDLGQIIGAADHAAALVRQLLSFSRAAGAAPRVIEVSGAVSATLPMLRRLVGEDVALHLTLPEEPWRARVDPGALEQVVVNLVVNARDAMPRGGSIDVEVQHLTLTAGAPPARELELGSGDYVVLCVTDEGEGIAPDVIERMFDPFFTTKEVGRGTGLGLSTVYGIARRSGGTVAVHSEVGHGSTFRVYFPRALEDDDAPRPPPAPLPRGSETVLLVEDEPRVRAFALRALESLGYTVIEAAGGDDAVTRCRAHEGAIDLVLTDVVMPGLTGPQVAEALAAVRPGLRTLYMSGYTQRAARARGGLPEGALLVEKPITLDRLGRAVRAALEDQGSSTTRQ